MTEPLADNSNCMNNSRKPGLYTLRGKVKASCLFGGVLATLYGLGNLECGHGTFVKVFQDAGDTHDFQ